MQTHWRIWTYTCNTINDLVRYQRKIDSFILEYNLTISYATYYELEISLCKYFNISNYSEINVGPLCENRLVRELFKLSDNVKVNDLKANQVTYLDLFRYLRKYLDEKQLWSLKNIQSSDFESYLMDKLGLDFLPVRINSLPVMIGVMKNVKRLYNEAYKKAEINFTEEIRSICENQREMIKADLYKKLDEIDSKREIDSQLYLLTIEPDNLLNELLIMFELILSENDYEYLNDFLKTIKSHEYLKYILSLALYMCKQSDLKYYLEKLNVQPTNSNSYTNILKRIFLKLADYLTKKQLKSFLNKFLFERKIEIVDFDSIKRKHIHFNENAAQSDAKECSIVEEKSDNIVESTTNSNQPILSDFIILSNIKELMMLKLTELDLIDLLNCLEDSYFKLLNSSKPEESSFISYLARNKNEFESLSIAVKNQEPTTNSDNQITGPLADYLKQIIKNFNIKHFTVDFKRTVENLLCSYYDVICLESLNPCFKTMNSLLDNLKLDDNENSDYIVYQDAVLGGLDSVSHSQENSDDELKFIYNLLNSCPLLDNIYEYTQWNTMYSQKYGSLKDFIRTSNKRLEVGIVGFEIMPSCLLKLTSDISINKLKEAIINLDYINGAGYLVSLIVVNYETLKKTPIMLISNEMYSTLFIIYTNGTLDSFYTFLVKFICRLPLKLSANCLLKLFIEPLAKIEGSAQVAKDNLWKHCDFKSRVYFHNLSILCCIPEWRLDRTQSNIADSNEVKDKPMVLSIEIEQPQEVNKVVEIKTEQLPVLCYEQNKDSSLLIPQQEIENIRLTKYGIGLTLNEQNEGIMQALKNEISSCLQTLSNELYNKDMHFVLELIQNADDNKYSQEISPTIIFMIDTDSITLFNNEFGFSGRNIQAISSIGSSTKGKQEHGYIGRKGIGFKSVFTVTNSPEIHSNGYHIKFDASTKQFGHFNYIVPIWCENENENLVKNKQILSKQISSFHEKLFNTCIYLPFKSENERQRHKSRSLTHSFNDIKSSLLLFLNRLKNITLINHVQLTKRFYTRVDKTENIIEIIENKFKLNQNDFAEFISQQWLIQRKKLFIPNAIEKPNGNIQFTDVCLAFPLYELSTTLAKSLLPKLDVYAYLPVRCYNFSFIIQADFMLTASRQDILVDNEWNQWLANEFPQLFIDAFSSFLNFYSKKINDKITIIRAYLKFIPFDLEVSSDFFQHIPKRIIQLVHNMEILPVLNEQNDLILKKPYECIFIKDKHIQELLSCNLLNNYLGRHYLDPKLYLHDDGSVDDHMLKLLLKLGVQQLQIDDVINIIKIIFSSQTVNFNHASEWLVILNNYLQTNSELNNKIVLNEIRRLKFIPLVNSNVLANLEKAIYFPYKFRNTNEVVNDNIIYLTNIIESELNIIDTNRLLCLENDGLNDCLVNLLNTLGIKTLNSEEIIQNHIIPTFESAESTIANIDYKTKFIIYFLYLQNCWLVNSQSVMRYFDKLKTTVLVLVTDSARNNESKFVPLNCAHLYLSSIYNSYDTEEFDENELLKNSNFNFIDSIYLNETIKLNKLNKKSNISIENLVENWRKFLNSFDIFDLYTPKKVMIDNQQDDYKCELFEYFIEKIKDFGEFDASDMYKMKFIGIFKKFFIMFNQKWTVLSQNYKYVKNAGLESNIETRFFQTLKTQPWVLVEINDYYLEMNEIKMRVYYKFLKASQVFIKSDTIVIYFGENKVPYLQSSLTGALTSKEFLKDLNFKDQLNFDEFLRFFKTSIIVSCFVKMSQIKKIYSLLSTSINSALNEDGFIFIPKTKSIVFDVVHGKFYSKKQVYWNDPTSLLVKYKENNASSFELRVHYSDMKNIFIDYFNCNEIPSLNEYIGLIEYLIRNLISEKIKLTSQLLYDIFNVYEIIYKKYCCCENGIIDNSMKQLFLNSIKNKTIFICHNNKYLCHNERTILLNDNFAIAKYFKDKLNFLVFPSKENESYCGFNESMFKNNKLNKNLDMFFTNVCNFNLFSSLIETKIDLDRDNLNIESISAYPACITQLLPYLQCFLYSKQEYADIYASFMLDKANGGIDLKMFQLNAIYLNHYFKPNQEINYANDNENKVYIQVFGKSLFSYFIRKDCLTNEKELIKGFLKIFFVNCADKKLEKDLLSFALYVNNSYLKLSTEIILSTSEKNELESDYDIKLNLPDNEKLWLINDSSDLNKLVTKTNKQININAQQHQQTIDPLFSVYTELAREQQNLPNELSQLPFANSRNYVTTNRSVTTTLQFNNQLIAENSLNNFMHKGNVNSKLFLTQNFSKNEIIIEDLTEEFRVNKNVKIEVYNKLTVNENLEEFKSKVGRWGESFIYKTLLNKYEKEIRLNLVKIEWLNEFNETGMPYDVKFIRYDENDWCTPKEEIFIEVKSTSKSDKELNDYFPVSVKEILFAINNSDNYHIYRLYNAFNQNLEMIKIKRITNIHNNLVKHNLNLVMIV